jgi:hypothetical protein
VTFFPVSADLARRLSALLRVKLGMLYQTGSEKSLFCVLG